MKQTQTPNLEKMGVQLSQTLEWDGLAVLRVAV